MHKITPWFFLLFTIKSLCSYVFQGADVVLHEISLAEAFINMNQSSFIFSSKALSSSPKNDNDNEIESTVCLSVNLAGS